MWTTIAAAALALAVPFLGPGSRLFGFVSLSPVEMGTVVAIVTTYLVATEAARQWFFRPHRGPRPRDRCLASRCRETRTATAYNGFDEERHGTS